MSQCICKAALNRLVVSMLLLSTALIGCEGVRTSSGGATATGISASFVGGGTAAGGSQGGSIAVTLARGSGV